MALISDIEKEGGSIRLLVVEDEAIIRLDIADSLQLAGFTVVEVETPKEALQILQSSGFDVVLTDVHFPGGVSGIDLARVLKQSRPETLVIIMSGVRSSEADAVWADAFVAKPVRDIAGVLRSLLESKQS